MDTRVSDTPANGNWRILSGSWLKMIAIVSMLTDHLAAFCWRTDPAFQEILFTIGHRAITPYVLMRMVGRLAFPLFAFLIVEGFQHTRNRKRYGLNLLLFALLSEIPWDLARFGACFHQGQNVMFTLLAGYLGLCATERFKDDWKRLLASLLGLMAAMVALRSDYSLTGFGLIIALYVLRDNRVLQAVVGTCLIPSKWIGGMAFIPINLYNGRRGFIKGTAGKYLFYLFYPLHLLVIHFFIH